MNPRGPATLTEPETDRQAAELAAMQRMLHAARGCFSLAVAVCNSPALRDYLIEQLRQTFPGIAVVNVSAPVVDVYGFVTAQPLDKRADAIFLVGLEKSIHLADPPEPGPSRDPTPETRHMLRSFNASRDLWETSFACPLVVWLPEYATTLLATHARDLWRSVSHRFEFVSEQATVAAGIADQFAGELVLAENLSEEQKRFRIAELEQRIVDASREPPKSLLPHIAVWLHELAFLFEFLGELDQAKATYEKALAIADKTGNLLGMVATYGNLGLVYRKRGELDRAEEMHKQALSIDKKLGSQERVANHYGTLGRIHHIGGELGRAEAMHKRALLINEKLGCHEGMADQYSSLGTIYRVRGELDRAEEIHKKALAINKKLGRHEGIADQYSKLGGIYLVQGDLDQAEELHRKAMAIHEKLGRQTDLARDCGYLGLIFLKRGELDRAEEMFEKALAIEERIGHPQGMAIDYANLGTLAVARGDLDRAWALWTKARDLYAKIGAPEVVKTQQWLDGLPLRFRGSP